MVLRRREEIEQKRNAVAHHAPQGRSRKISRGLTPGRRRRRVPPAHAQSHLSGDQEASERDRRAEAGDGDANLRASDLEVLEVLGREEVGRRVGRLEELTAGQRGRRLEEKKVLTSLELLNLRDSDGRERISE